MVLDDRNHHLLKTDTTMHEIQAAALFLDTYARAWCKCIIAVIHKLYRKQIIRRCALSSDQITTIDLHILLTRRGLIHLGILRQRTVGIQESVVRRNINTRTTELISNDPYNVFDFLDRVIACREHHAVRSMAGFIHLIMIDIDHIHPLYEGTSLCALHRRDIRIFQRNAVSVRRFQNLIPVSCFRGHAVCKDLQATTATS